MCMLDEAWDISWHMRLVRYEVMQHFLVPQYFQVGCPVGMTYYDQMLHLLLSDIWKVSAVWHSTYCTEQLVHTMGQGGFCLLDFWVLQPLLSLLCWSYTALSTQDSKPEGVAKLLDIKNSRRDVAYKYFQDYVFVYRCKSPKFISEKTVWLWYF